MWWPDQGFTPSIYDHIYVGFFLHKACGLGYNQIVKYCLVLSEFTKANKDMNDNLVIKVNISFIFVPVLEGDSFIKPFWIISTLSESLNGREAK